MLRSAARLIPWFAYVPGLLATTVAEIANLSVVSARTQDALSAHLAQWDKLHAASPIEVVFLDIDETLVIPATPFNYDLPRTLDFVRQFRKTCPDDKWRGIASKMEELYYDSPHMLVDPRWPQFMQGLAPHVVALTARPADDPSLGALVDTLQRFGIQFSTPWHIGTLPNTGAVTIDAEAAGGKVGGIILANSGDKGRIILEYGDYSPVAPISNFALVDNLLQNCLDAAQAGTQASNLTGYLSIHYTAAYDLDGAADDMEFLVAKWKGELGISPEDCPLGLVGTSPPPAVEDSDDDDVELWIRLGQIVLLIVCISALCFLIGRRARPSANLEASAPLGD